MNLNQVCLCFEAYQKINGQYVAICEPVLSNAINNMSTFNYLLCFFLINFFIFF